MDGGAKFRAENGDGVGTLENGVIVGFGAAGAGEFAAVEPGLLGRLPVGVAGLELAGGALAAAAPMSDFADLTSVTAADGAGVETAGDGFAVGRGTTGAEGATGAVLAAALAGEAGFVGNTGAG